MEKREFVKNTNENAKLTQLEKQLDTRRKHDKHEKKKQEEEKHERDKQAKSIAKLMKFENLIVHKGKTLKRSEKTQMRRKDDSGLKRNESEEDFIRYVVN